MEENAELRDWWAGHGMNVEPVLEKLRAASEYLGDEIVITGFAGPDGKMRMPVFLAEARREGFSDFVAKERLMPSSRQARMIRRAISPRFAIRRRLIIVVAPNRHGAALNHHKGHQGHKGKNPFRFCPLCPSCPLCPLW